MLGKELLPRQGAHKGGNELLRQGERPGGNELLHCTSALVDVNLYNNYKVAKLQTKLIRIEPQ